MIQKRAVICSFWNSVFCSKIDTTQLTDTLIPILLNWRFSVVYTSFLHNNQCQYVVFGSKCSFRNNNKKRMFVPDCAYHWHANSHFMILKCWVHQILYVHYVYFSFQVKRVFYCTFWNTSKLALVWSAHLDWMSHKAFVVWSTPCFLCLYWHKTYWVPCSLVL